MSSDPKSSGWVKSQLQNLFAPTDNKLAMKLFGSKKALMKVNFVDLGNFLVKDLMTPPLPFPH